MANNKDHFRAYLRGAIPIIALWIATWFIDKTLFVPEWVIALQSSIVWNYLLVSRYIDPDLDQISITGADGRMKREIPILGMIFALYWTQYSAIVNMLAIATGTSRGRYGAHRTFWTHSYFGTFLRFIWFNIPAGVLTSSWNELMISIGKSPISYSVIAVYLIGQLIALVRSDSIHYRLDGL